MTIVAKNIEVEMFVGICDFEYEKKQKVQISMSATGNVPNHPKNIQDCLDYSKICNFIKSWENKKHVDLLETLLMEVFDFIFSQDNRILEASVEITKPDVFSHVEKVGVCAHLTREQFFQAQQ